MMLLWRVQNGYICWHVARNSGEGYTDNLRKAQYSSPVTCKFLYKLRAEGRGRLHGCVSLATSMTLEKLRSTKHPSSNDYSFSNEAVVVVILKNGKYRFIPSIIQNSLSPSSHSHTPCFLASKSPSGFDVPKPYCGNIWYSRYAEYTTCIVAARRVLLL